MNRRDTDLDPELEAFLTFRRIRRGMPSELRMRVLAHARAFLAGDAPPLPRLPETPPTLARGRRLVRIALGASFLVAGAAVGAIAGVTIGAVAARYDLGADISPDGLPPGPAVAVARVGAPSPEPPTPAPDREAAAPPHTARHSAKSDPFTAELQLLQRAHAAYTRHDFSLALTLVGAHERRFPRGQLAEQREALRVRSLAGAGRADEAHRAAAAFAVRFPRSVLLPRFAGGMESSEP